MTKYFSKITDFVDIKMCIKNFMSGCEKQKRRKRVAQLAPQSLNCHKRHQSLQ
jgi:hypothetical protein